MNKLRTVKPPVSLLTRAWTLSLSLLFLKSCLALFFITSLASANPWIVSEELHLPKAETEVLKRRIPEVQTIDDAQILLTSITLRYPFTEVWLEWADGHYMIRGQRGKPVTKIDFKLAPLSLIPQLRNVTSSQIGQVHTSEVQDKVLREVQAVLTRQGYQTGKAIPSVSEDEDGFSYTIELDIGEPCMVKGYKWESPPPIKPPDNLKPGDICDLDEALKAVADLEARAKAAGYAETNLSFDKFQFDTPSQAAWVSIRGSFGERFIYEFIDQKTGKDLSNIFSSKDMQAFDPSLLSPDSVSFELLRQLKQRGYSNAQIVNVTTSTTESKHKLHQFFVNVGTIAVITRLQIEGNQNMSENEIITLLGIERTSQSETTDNETVYNQDAIASGLEKIRATYVTKGFWNVKISDRQVQSQTNDGLREKIIVVISIEEGDQFIFDSFKFSGNKEFSADELTELATLEEGKALNQSQLLEFQQSMRSEYGSKGYFYANVLVEPKSHKNPATGLNQVAVEVTIEEGPRVKFGEVFVTGLVKTKPQVVYRELYFNTGDWYDPELITASRKALLRTGAFSSAMIAPLDPDLAFKKSAVVDLVVQVIESPSRTVSFGPGWSSYYGMRYNVEAALTNIAGTGRQLFGRASFNEEANQKAIGSKTLVGRSISAGYLEPYILNSQIDATLALSQSARATEYAWSLTRGGELELSHHLRFLLQGSKVSTFYGRKINAEEGTREDVDAFLADTFSVGRAGLRFNFDKRNDVTWTTSGYIFATEFSWARYDLGGDLRYFRWELTNNKYMSLFEDFVIALGISFTSYEDVERTGQANGDVLPASERLPAGGADTIRGFKERSIGPIVRRPSLNAAGQWDCGYTESPTGGSKRLVLKGEARYRFTSSFAGTLFVDSGFSNFSREEMLKFERAFANVPPPPNAPGCAGTPTKSIEDNHAYEISDVVQKPQLLWTEHYTSIGTAINFLTPIGSINLAYGVPWHEPVSEICKDTGRRCYYRSDQTQPLWRRGEVHFNVGAKF